MKKIALLVAALFTIFFVPTLPWAEAYDSVYSDAGSGDWADPLNWDLGVPPSNGTYNVSIEGDVYDNTGSAAWVNTAVFNGVWDTGLTLTVATMATFNDGINDNAGTINGNVTFNGNSSISNGTVNGSVAFVGNTNTNQRGTIDAGVAGTVTGNFKVTSTITLKSGTVSSVISSTGNVSKSGTGTVTMNGTNTYTGVTRFIGGTLSVATIGDGGVAGNLGAASSTATNLSFQGGTLQYTGVTASTNRNFTIAAGTSTIDVSNAGTTLTISGASNNCVGGLNKAGDGTLNLTGNNLHTGTTTVSAGTLSLGRNGGTLLDSANVMVSGGTLDVAYSDTVGSVVLTSGTIGGPGTLTTTNSFELRNGIVSAALGGLGKYLWVTSGGIVTLSGTSTYTGITYIDGTLSVATIGDGGVAGNLGAASNNASNLDLRTTGKLQYTGATAGTDRGFTIGAGGTGTIEVSNAATTLTISGSSASTTGALTKTGPGTLKLSGASNHTGLTTVSAGTLASSGTRTMAGALTVAGGAALDVGTDTLTITGSYIQSNDSALNVTVSSASAAGKVIYSAAGTVSLTSSVAVTVPTDLYIPTGATFTIIDGGGAGVNRPGTITSNNSRVAFSGAASSGDLIITANRSSTGFSSVAANSNESAIGNVLDNVTSPTSDMTTVLNTLNGLNNSQTDSALNSMEPDTDGAALQVTQATLDQLTDAVLGRQESLRGETNGSTGVSSGTEMLKGVDVWAQAFGSYLHQDPRQSSQGYNANIWGTALGFDLPIIDLIRIGTCFGFAQDYVRGKDNSNRSDINSYQWTIYGEYAKDAYYIDLSGSFAFNTYDASRQVAVGAINRTALADYNGQQYAAYIEGGYTFNSKKDLKQKFNLNLTPVVSFQYQHLYLDKYTETGANAMNLTVKAQNYDIAQSGFGIKLDYPLDTKYGKLVPELRFKWLYDWIGDAQANTSTFNGGGGSFATNGFTPAQSSWDFGAKLTMFTKKNWTCAANYDFELKEDFYGHYGYVNAKYSF